MTPSTASRLQRRTRPPLWSQWITAPTPVAAARLPRTATMAPRMSAAMSRSNHEPSSVANTSTMLGRTTAIPTRNGTTAASTAPNFCRRGAGAVWTVGTSTVCSPSQKCRIGRLSRYVASSTTAKSDNPRQSSAPAGEQEGQRHRSQRQQGDCGPDDGAEVERLPVGAHGDRRPADLEGPGAGEADRRRQQRDAEQAPQRLAEAPAAHHVGGLVGRDEHAEHDEEREREPRRAQERPRPPAPRRGPPPPRTGPAPGRARST